MNSKFAVYDNGKPAKYPECNVHPSWDNNSFDSFEKAIEYTSTWLGMLGEDFIYPTIKLNEPYDYSGYGDLIEIRAE